MDVKSAFLNGILRAKVYASQPDGFVDPENPNHVYKLKKALYGLKQAPRAWYDLLSSFLLSQKFTKGIVDPTFGYTNGGEIQTVEDPQGKAVDPTRYRRMIGTLMYLTSSRPTLYLLCACVPGFLHCSNSFADAEPLRVLPRTKKHIDSRHHFIKEQLENEMVDCNIVRTEYQLADIFNKPLA
ncbi:retrovirus-related pol polyprotein from transposon TNT 1-94 [Tanacetum coccineum]